MTNQPLQLSLLPLNQPFLAPKPPAPGTQSVAVEQARARLTVACLFFLLCSLAVSWRLIDAMVLREEGDIGLPKIASLTLPPSARADIVDRNGQLLATSLTMASMYVDSPLVLDPEETAKKLVKALPELKKKEVLEKLKSGKRFVWLKRHLTPRQHAAVHRLGLPGIYFQDEEQRVYPFGSLAAHVVGYTGVDGSGLAGLEKAFDQELRTSAKPLTLSLDSRLQHILHREMRVAIQEFQSTGGAGMIMDARTGELLALASFPDFDPHTPAVASENQLFNRATLGSYEMGSTFKIFNTALALDSGLIHMNNTFDATRPIRVGRHTISDFHPENRWMNVAEIFKVSSNIGSVRMALQVGPQSQRKFMEKLGLTHKSPLEIPEVGLPQIPQPWSEVSAMTIAFGHGMSVTPVQLVGATAAMINGGTQVFPTLLKKDSVVEGQRVISPETSDHLRRLMRLVVTEGTAKNANVKGYVVGGKTGTAEKAKGKGYNAKALLSSFIGAFPMQDPRYIVFVMLDEPKGNAKTYGLATGGWTAAPVAARVIESMGPLMGMAPFDATTPQIRQALKIDLPMGGKSLASFTPGDSSAPE